MANAQRIEDSLKTLLQQNNLSFEQRITTMGQLASTIVQSDTHRAKESIAIVQQALALAKAQNSVPYKAFMYAQLCFAYWLNDSSRLAQQSLDSALYYEPQIPQSDKIKGYIWYCKGWKQSNENQPNEAITSLLKALRLLNGLQQYKYETSIYNILAAIYADWHDLPNHEKYARLCLASALQSNSPDRLCTGYHTLSNSFEARFRNDTAQRKLLDSALYYNEMALAVFNQNEPRVVAKTELPFIALNIANLFAEFYPGSYRDSAMHYLHTALQLGERLGNYNVVANCYGILSDYAVADNHLSQAQDYLLAAMKALQKNPVPYNRTMSEVLRSLSSIAEKKGDLKEALRYYKQYVELYKQVYDEEQMATGKRLEAQYQAEKKEQALAALQQKITFSKQLNTIYIFLTISSLLAVFLLFFAYTQRSKAMRQQQQLHQLEVQKIKQEHHISLLSAILESQEQERTRLARDLHDGLGGLLSGIKIELSELGPLQETPASQKLLQNSLLHLDDAVDELRRIARSMMPELLLKYGLGEAIKEYCVGLKKTGVNITCQVFNYNNSMNESRQVIVYRIMQELVNNAMKHAAASQILVQLQQTGDTLFLTVEDDGKGFDTALLDNPQGAGLANIKARVDFLNGKIDINSQPGTGTAITIECTIN